MKKYIVIACMLFASFSFVHAAGVYLGVGYGTGSGTQSGFTTADSDGSRTDLADSDFDATLMDFKLGLIFDSNNRLELSSTTIETEANGATVDIEGLDLDYIWTIGTKGSMVLPFVTAGFGLQELQLGVDGKNTGFTLNVGAGVYFLVTDAVEVELSYRNKMIDYSATHLSSAHAFETDLDHSIGLSYLGVKFKF